MTLVIWSEPPPAEPNEFLWRRIVARLDTLDIQLDAIQASIDAIAAKLDTLAATLNHNQETTMATLADVTASLQAETDAETAVETLLTTISADLTTALQGNNPAALQAIVQQLNTNKDKLAAAIVANTPAGPTTPPASGTPTLPGGGVVTSPTISGGATGVTSVPAGGSGAVTVPGAPGETPTTPGSGSAPLPGATVSGAGSTG